MTLESASTRIWLGLTDSPPPDVSVLTDAARQLRTRYGSRWRRRLARAVCRALEEAPLWGTTPWLLLTHRPLRMARGRARAPVTREPAPPAPPVNPAHLWGYGIPPFARSWADARPSTET